VGGGAFPGVVLPTTLVVIPTRSPDSLRAALRRADPPIIARTVDDAVALDVRTMRDEEFGMVVRAVERLSG
jgi:L-seryl-tRNA(Ser) seleniumtransferase